MKMKTFFAAAFAALMAVGAASAQTKSKSLVLYFSLVGGLPNFSRQAITGAALVLLNVTAARYGESMIAALSISSKIVAVAFMIMIGWGQGFQPICAMNYGAQQYERVKKAFITTVAVGTVFLSVASIILYIFAEHWMQLMSTDEEVVSTGVSILRMQCFSLPLLGVFAVSSMFMQNIGNYFSALLISISRQGFFMCRSYIFCLPYTAKPESTCCSRFPIFYPSCLPLQLCFDGIENCRRFRQAIENCNVVRTKAANL